ncbi:hypothetical protein BLS_008905 [Venturia inaequalis]|uniref:Zinc finger CHCC-type domain-containing protein n=1 Tax=Venturia inaequalis TaxID=5025 RepID=A0A8H3U4K5_VENIN|nr:hypothetical protein BLS_008905 [Venturia inaequalis]KAE9982689.1 hypothetical protein EG328_010682 [Venturia inaequalis]
MLPILRLRSPALARRTAARAYSSTVDRSHANDPKPQAPVQNVSATNATPTSSEGSSDRVLVEKVKDAEEMRVAQAPNRADVWSRSQNPRAKAMVGPRFEQTIMEDQPRPLAAIDLIHKQPVRWRHERVVSCDGGGGPLGHPRIFINLDKPQIAGCTYCGTPFANEHHRAYLESLPSTPYPLTATGDPAQVPESQRVSDEPLGQR